MHRGEPRQDQQARKSVSIAIPMYGIEYRAGSFSERVAVVLPLLSPSVPADCSVWSSFRLLRRRNHRRDLGLGNAPSRGENPAHRAIEPRCMGADLLGEKGGELETGAAHVRFPFISKRVGFPAAINFSSASP